MKKKKNLYMILAFFTPIFFFLLVMYSRLGTIDGNYIMISDMEAQYNSLFQYLKNVLNGTESLFYSFHKGLGGEMFTAFTYYLSSPLNLIVLFFEDGQLPNCILLIILVKLGLSGLTMNIYLYHKNSTNLKSNFIFSICYALMAYTVNYYWNIMWLDAMYMLPIVIFGLEKVIDDKKPLLYIISLSYTIICNYYMGYMVCLFVLLYFIYQIVIQNKRDKTTIIIFIISSILSAGIASFILLPTIMQISSFASTQGNLSINFSYILEILKGLIKNIIFGSHKCSEVSNQYGTYLYIGNFCLILYILFFTSKQIDRKEKIISGVITIVFLLSFILLPIAYIWHGFSIPSYLNNRHSFLFCFFMITMAMKTYRKINNIAKKDICILFTIYFTVSCVAIAVSKELLNNIIITWLFMIIYIFLIKMSKKSGKSIYHILLVIIVMLEIFINLYLSFVSKTIIATSYDEYVNNTCSVVSSNHLNFRTENTVGKNGIDGLTCNYNSVTTFLSTVTKKDIQFFNKYGYASEGKAFHNTTSNTTLMDSLLGIRYYYLNNSDSKTRYLSNSNICNDIQEYNEEIQTIKKQTYCLYENPNSLSIGYIVKNLNYYTAENAFENQNELFKTITGIKENVLYPVNFTHDNLEYHVENNGEPFYIYINSEQYQREEGLELYVNGEQIYKEWDSSNLVNNVLEIISESAMTDLKIIINNHSIINSIDIYQMNTTLVNNTLSNINNNLTIESINKDGLKGKIRVEEDGYLLLTIPYNRNLKLYIDNVQLDTLEVFDYLTAVVVSKGEHTFEIVYNKKIYYISTLISILSVFITTFFVKKCKKTHKNKKIF